MELHILSFAKIVILQPDIAEVIIDDGVLMDLAMVRQYHHFLIDRLRPPFSLLINKINEYQYNFEAQLAIGNIPQIHAMAIVAYTRKSQITTNLLTDTTPRKSEWNFRLFPQRDMALEWLEEQQQQVRQCADTSRHLESGCNDEH